MGIDSLAAVAACSQNSSSGSSLPSGSGNGQLSQLQRLEQSIRKLESDYRVEARSHGVSSVDIQSKVREFDSLLGKLDNQIQRLQQEKRQSDTPSNGRSSKRLGVSLLQYNTDVTMVALRNSGNSIHTVLSQTADAVQTKMAAAQAEHAAQAKEQAVEAQEEKQQAEIKRDSAPGTLNVLA